MPYWELSAYRAVTDFASTEWGRITIAYAYISEMARSKYTTLEDVLDAIRGADKAIREAR